MKGQQKNTPWAMRVVHQVGRPARMAELFCRHCGATHRRNAPPNTPREALAKKFAQDGWRVGTTTADCPDCQAGRKAHRTDPEKEIRAMTAKQKEALDQVREPTRAENLKILEALIGCFQVTDAENGAGRYLDGCTDQSVGKELDLPWRMVAMVRERHFGAVLPPDEVTALQNEIDTLKSMVADLQGKQDALVKALTGK